MSVLDGGLYCIVQSSVCRRLAGGERSGLVVVVFWMVLVGSLLLVSYGGGTYGRVWWYCGIVVSTGMMMDGLVNPTRGRGGDVLQIRCEGGELAMMCCWFGDGKWFVRACGVFSLLLGGCGLLLSPPLFQRISLLAARVLVFFTWYVCVCVCTYFLTLGSLLISQDRSLGESDLRYLRFGLSFLVWLPWGASLT